MLKTALKTIRNAARTGFLLAIFVAGLAILVWGLTFSPSYQRCVAGEHERGPQQAEETTLSNIGILFRCEATPLDRHAGALTGIATIFLTIITGWLVLISRTQSKTARTELRAYVFAQVSKLETFSLTEPIVVTVAWKNAGRTPASAFETHGGVFIGSLPLEDDAHFDDKPPGEPEPVGRHSKAALSADGEISIDYSSEKSLSDPKVQEAIIKKRLAIYTVGRAFYRDVFGENRASLFCNFIDPDDAAKLIEAERKNLALTDFKVRFSTAHVLNDFT